MSRTIESQISLLDARERIRAYSEPGDAIEISLGEAVGLVLAEPIFADVDHPPFDRATHDGYAVRAGEASIGALLRIVEAGRLSRAGGPTLEAGEAGRVLAGDPIPPGSDCVARPAQIRPDPETGRTRVIEVLKAARVDDGVTRRGIYLRAGATLLEAGTQIHPAMVPLLASQGCVHPLCHRRVRVSILTVGDQWVRPDEAPGMNRERNAANAALVALTVRAEAMAHDFQAVVTPMIRPTLERAATSPVIVILGLLSRPLARSLRAIGYEPVIAGIAATTIGRARYGVIRDDEGRVVNHVFQLPANPVAAAVGFSLLVEPLIGRLQGALEQPTGATMPLAPGTTHAATGRRSQIRRAVVRAEPDSRASAEVLPGPLDDLVAWSRADGLLIFPEHSGPWHAGQSIDFVSFGRKY